ncbi:unnamed protein product [Meloidogyne enterolobii]|uniref:Uncharacterized protein n=1 Tax=Meloidogyne enterolobii TaxID=390850 RepID=A0ACB1AFE8_MELEN
MEEGISATAYKTERSFNNQIVLNTPIEATFSSTNPFKCKNKLLPEKHLQTLIKTFINSGETNLFRKNIKQNKL